MACFETFFQNKFDVGELGRHVFWVRSCNIGERLDGSTTVTQIAKSDTNDTTRLQTLRPTEENSPTSNDNLHTLRRVLRKVLYTGRTTSPTLLYHASAMARKTSDFQARHLEKLQSTISCTLTALPTHSFRSTPMNNRFTLSDDYDAALCKRLTDPFDCHHGFVIFCRRKNVIHSLHWGAHRSRREVYSSTTAEILAAAETVDVLLYPQTLLNELYYPYIAGLITDSRLTFNVTLVWRLIAQRLSYQHPYDSPLNP